jgi:hypothetical protein
VLTARVHQRSELGDQFGPDRLETFVFQSLADEIQFPAFVDNPAHAFARVFAGLADTEVVAHVHDLTSYDRAG